jgi:hypothetical protein
VLWLWERGQAAESYDTDFLVSSLSDSLAVDELRRTCSTTPGVSPYRPRLTRIIARAFGDTKDGYTEV